MTQAGILWNLLEIPWNSMEVDKFDVLKNIIPKHCIFLYLSDDYVLFGQNLIEMLQHWFKYHNSYFEHANVRGNGPRAAKMAYYYGGFFPSQYTQLFHM